jgi:superfamily I DNA and/or RNA helicase
MEPETLIPLSVVTPAEEESALPASARPVIVLCGDIKQLPAIVSCDQAREGGLDVSLLERLMERPLYHETERHITCLAINYRSHSGILWLPNTLFYNNRLQPCNSVPLSAWSGLPNPKLPILVKHVDGEDDWVEEVSAQPSVRDCTNPTPTQGASWFNKSEVEECRDIVRSILKSTGYQQSEIGVVTPWREQVLYLREEFRKSGLWDVNIGNVEVSSSRTSLDCISRLAHPGLSRCRV